MIEGSVLQRDRPPDLGGFVRPPAPSYWEPPRALNPSEDPYLLSKVLSGLRHLYRAEGHREIGMPPHPRHPAHYGRTRSGRGNQPTPWKGHHAG
jgi:hypothetical protein